MNAIENKKDERNKENKTSNIDSNYFNKTTLVQKYAEREINYNNERMEVVDTHSKYFKSKQSEQNPVSLNKNIDNIKQNEYLNDDLINYNEDKNLYKDNKALEKNPYNINKIASKNYKEGGNYPKFNDSISMNTLESVTIKKIDEDEERRTYELEQETKRLKDLEIKILGKNNIIEDEKLFWNEEALNDPNELIMKNTLMNEVQDYQLRKNNFFEEKSRYRIIRHVEWGDNKKFARQMVQPGLVHYNIDKDLFLKTGIEDINIHTKNKPLRSCIKSNLNLSLSLNIASTVKKRKKDVCFLLI